MSGLADAIVLVTLALSCTFAVAGIAKLLDPRGSREAAEAFGVPDRFVGVMARGLPLAEIAIAVLLLPIATRWWAALCALVLLIVFCAGIARALKHGEAPECHCFGQLHSAPAGWNALARNGALSAAAALIVVQGRDEAGPSAFGWMSRLDGTEGILLALSVALVLTVVVGGYALLQVMRSYGHVLVRLESIERSLADAGFDLHEHEQMPEIGLEPGTPAPAFSLRDVRGVSVTLQNLLEPTQPLLLLFTSPTCGPCKGLLPIVSRWQQQLAEFLTIALVSSGAHDAIRTDAEEHGLGRVLIDGDGEVYSAYQANGTPSAVLVSTDGLVASWVASGADWVEHLVQGVAAAHDFVPESQLDEGIPVGEPAPELVLADLDGRSVSLADFRGAETALVFWSPSCGYCRAVRGDLLEWERIRNGVSPQLVVVSSGDPEETRQDGFASPVLVDREFAAGSAFGASGTPMAVLIDAEGRMASHVAAGSSAVLTLLRRGLEGTEG